MGEDVAEPQDVVDGVGPQGEVVVAEAADVLSVARMDISPGNVPPVVETNVLIARKLDICLENVLREVEVVVVEEGEAEVVDVVEVDLVIVADNRTRKSLSVVTMNRFTVPSFAFIQLCIVLVFNMCYI